MISGQDFPIESTEEIIEYLKSDTEKNYMNLFVSKNNGATISTNYDKRNEIVFPEWMLRQEFRYRIYRRLWVSITGGYHHTFSIFKRKDPYNMKYYYGSSWFCVNSAFVKYVLEFLNYNTEYIEFYKRCSCPDESFFQTLLMNSDFRNTRMEYLHYIDWSEGKSSPKILTCSDLDKAFSSEKLMCRKIDSDVDKNVIPEIIARIENKVSRV